MQQFLFVLLPVWLALVGWLIGALVRLGAGPASRRVYGWVWLAGSLAMWVHIFGSYAVVYQWSHAEALAATADESQRVTGIRAPWGVYVNFVFAMLWTVTSIWLVSGKGIPVLVERTVFWFTAAIVCMSTVVFEGGLVRIISLCALAALTICSVRKRNESPSTDATSDPPPDSRFGGEQLHRDGRDA